MRQIHLISVDYGVNNLTLLPIFAGCGFYPNNGNTTKSKNFDSKFLNFDLFDTETIMASTFNVFYYLATTSRSR